MGSRRIAGRFLPRWLPFALLVFCIPLLGQDACEEPPPKLPWLPLALDCVIAGNDVYIPLEPVLQPDRSYLTAHAGTIVDTSMTVRLPDTLFCALDDAGYTQVDLGAATITMSPQGTMKPVPPEVAHPATGLPVASIDTASACAGSLGTEVVVDFPAVTWVPWGDGAGTVDFLLTVGGIDITLTNTFIGGSPASDVSLVTLCEPTDRSVPPNGATTDPEDSPRIAADGGRDGTYDVLAGPLDQVFMSVNGYCLGYPCNDGNDCTVDNCDPRRPWGCSYSNEPAGTACSDNGNPGTCQAGVCVVVAPGCGGGGPFHSQCDEPVGGGPIGACMGDACVLAAPMDPCVRVGVGRINCCSEAGCSVASGAYCNAPLDDVTCDPTGVEPPGLAGQDGDCVEGACVARSGLCAGVPCRTERDDQCRRDYCDANTGQCVKWPLPTFEGCLTANAPGSCIGGECEETQDETCQGDPCSTPSPCHRAFCELDCWDRPKAAAPRKSFMDPNSPRHCEIVAKSDGAPCVHSPGVLGQCRLGGMCLPVLSDCRTFPVSELFPNACEDYNLCTDDVCDGSDGICDNIPLPDGEPCARERPG